jgi:cytochrome P450
VFAGAERLGPEYFRDPNSVHERLRDRGPVVPVIMPDGMPAWVVTGYADVRAALADPRLIKDWRQVMGPAEIPEDHQESAEGAMLGLHMLNLDPPDHTRLRRLVTKAFTARRVEQLRPRVGAITASLLSSLPALSSLQADGSVDLLEAFAFPLPVTVICELLGVPAEDRDDIRFWSAAAVSSTMPPQDVRAAVTTMASYFPRLIAAKRQAPAGSADLLSALIQAQDAGDRLSENELVSMIFLLLVAGHETTVNLIASGTLTLLLHAELRERLLADRSLLPGAIEELLRYVSPVNHATLRFTTAATPITGVTIPERQVVLLALSAANRDPSRFPAPDQADIGRDTSGHLAFGHGIHYCLGAPLARLEAEIAFGALLDAFPRMALAVPPESLRWRPSTLIHGLESLPVQLGG